ncbi:MAG: hypothetical protein WCV99_13465 [Sterolibacterium sp.]|jgi:hypothetical protein
MTLLIERLAPALALSVLLSACGALPIEITTVGTFIESDAQCRAVNRNISTRLNPGMWITACVWRWQSQCHVITSPACASANCKAHLADEIKNCAERYEDGQKTGIGYLRAAEVWL